jgi:hypothetical protein
MGRRLGPWGERPVLTVAEAAVRLGRSLNTIRRWSWEDPLSGRLGKAERVIEDGDVHAIEDELHPMAELPEEWQTGDDGSPAPNWVAALHRSRSGR